MATTAGAVTSSAPSFNFSGISATGAPPAATSTAIPTFQGFNVPTTTTASLGLFGKSFFE